MHTDDDKNGNKQSIDFYNTDSGSNYSDFYSEFTDKKDDDKSKKSTKKQKKSSSKKKTEDLDNNYDYSDFYSNDSLNESLNELNNNSNEIENDSSNEKNNKIKIIIVIALAIILLALIFFLFKIFSGNDSDLPGINLLTENINIDVGESSFISYEVINTEDLIEISFRSLDTNIATVDEKGNILGIKEGETTVIASYKVNGKNKEKKCNVTVKANSEVGAPALSLSLANAKEGTWSKENVTVNVSATSGASLKYTVNCTNNCKYTNVTNNKIVISNNGASVVKVIASKDNKETTKSITVNIDKKAPTVTLSANPSNYMSNTSVKVCAKCSDGESGCTQNEVCETYTTSQTNKTITVVDKAGNSVTSSKFNVTINNNGGSSVNNPPSLTLSLANVKEGTWSKNNVTINVNATSGASLKYTVNCTNNCNYTNVTNNKIVISNNGTSVVKVIASKDNKETTKSITVYIDKTAPTVTLSATPANYTSNTSVRVCAKCSDGESGCTQNEVCETYTTSQTNKTITVTDKAGNSKTSSKFNVTINKTTPTCTLSVSRDGLVTATVKDATKYSFDSSFKTNEKTKQLTTTQDTTVTYYVKDDGGQSNTCSINVGVESVCYYGRSPNCYKSIVGSKPKGTTEDQCNAENNEWSPSENTCYILANPGWTYTYFKK